MLEIPKKTGNSLDDWAKQNRPNDDQSIASAAAAALAKNAESNAVARPATKSAEIKQLLESMRPQLESALVRKVRPDHIVSVALSLFRANPRLLDCSKNSLLSGILKSTQLDLSLDPALGQAYLIPFSNHGKMEAQFQIGYQGLLTLAWRSNMISSINAGIVRDGENFVAILGKNETLEHEPGDDDESPINKVYAYAHLRGGGFTFDVMSVSQIERIRSRSKSGKIGPWVTDWEEMAKKTVFKRLTKKLPKSVELAQAIEADNRAESGQSVFTEFQIENEEI